jgi:hypothetical protein
MNKDINWYLKWTATSVLIVGTAVNSAGYFPLGPVILFFGGLIWLTVAIRWREPALIVTNAVMAVTSILGFIWFFAK